MILITKNVNIPVFSIFVENWTIPTPSRLHLRILTFNTFISIIKKIISELGTYKLYNFFPVHIYSGFNYKYDTFHYVALGRTRPWFFSYGCFLWCKVNDTSNV